MNVHSFQILINGIFSPSGTARFNSPNLLLVIAGGISEHDEALPSSINLAATLRTSSNTRILSVGFGNFNMNELIGITSYEQTENQVTDHYTSISFCLEIMLHDT